MVEKQEHHPQCRVYWPVFTNACNCKGPIWTWEPDPDA